MLTKYLFNSNFLTINSINFKYVLFLIVLMSCLLGINLSYADSEHHDHHSGSGSGDAKRAHASISEYLGPETCIGCHETQALEVHGSVHYQQTGMTPNVTNIDGNAGKSEEAFNTYCGSIRTSPIFTCAGCHVGNGLAPTQEATQEQLNNIDCLMCHQNDYARIGAPPYEDVVVVGPDGKPTTISIPVEETFRFMPDESKMNISILEAARTVHPTTRKTCLRCHAGASGSDGGKRGDISSVTVDPPKSSDIHMSSHGEDLRCADCHDADNHRVFGRGLDLRPNDHPKMLTCARCHSEQPHSEGRRRVSTLDTHANRVACQTCHIPKFAKDISTELVRDWTHPHFSSTACGGRGGWVPDEVRASNVIPSYKWFDGSSEVYILGQIPKENSDGEKAFGIPNGDVNSDMAKIYPMKEHRSLSAQHDATGVMIPHSTYTFFTTSSFDAAVRVGMEEEGLEGSYTLVNVHTYQTINHGVEDDDNALSCGECHSSYNSRGTPRMDLANELGYELKGPKREVCTQCHSREEDEGFEKVHKQHVKEERIECSSCHNFTRPERNLMNISKFQD